MWVFGEVVLQWWSSMVLILSLSWWNAGTFYTGIYIFRFSNDFTFTVYTFSLYTLCTLFKDAMSDFCPQTLKNRFFWVNGISKSITHSNQKKSLTFTFNEPWQKFKTFLIKHIRIGHVIYCQDPDITNFEQFISLLLIIGGLFRAMAQMKACEFTRPPSKYILNFKSKRLGQIGQKSDIASLNTSVHPLNTQITFSLCTHKHVRYSYNGVPTCLLSLTWWNALWYFSTLQTFSNDFMYYCYRL